MQRVQWLTFVAPTAAWACVAVGTREQMEGFLATRPDSEMVVRSVNGAKCSTHESLFKEWASVLDFPGYFGHNWDAFHDCMTDMSWLPGSSYTVVVSDFDKVLPGTELNYKLFLESLEDSAKAGVRTVGWPPGVSERPGRLTFVFHVEESNVVAVDSRLSDTGVSVPFYQLP